jgi:Arc/MetJ family transcription regulator
MLKKIEVEIDDDLVQEVIQRYRLADAREAIGLALRTLLSEGDDADAEQQDDEYDEFSDLSAWEPRRGSDTG